jgi:predicted dehydrogenase
MVMKRLRLGMVGGGQGAFIGGVHRYAARLDGHWDLVAGALSSNPSRAADSARDLGISPDRCYTDFRRMAHAEATRGDGIDAVAIVTPNHMHADPAIAFLDAGIHVICDKPLAATQADAEAIARAVDRSGKLFILTHNYTGYPLIRQAREMVTRGDIGTPRVVQVEYAQDWLTKDIESSGNKQASWRTDPEKSGIGGAVADIGTHAFNLVSFVTGLELDQLSCDLSSFVPGRQLDDNVNVMLRFKSGAKGLLWASQVAPGNENGLRLRIYGNKGGLEWEQENPNRMTFTLFGKPKKVLTRGGASTNEASLRVTRVPSGHPEGYLEAFATIYSEAASLVHHANSGKALVENSHAPNLSDGLLGMKFISACVKSSNQNSCWVKID